MCTATVWAGFSQCAEHDDEQMAGEGNYYIASIESSPSTRTVVSDNQNGTYAVKWEGNDAIGVYYGSGNTPMEFSVKTGEGTTQASFEGPETTGQALFAVYPYSSEFIYSENEVTVKLANNVLNKLPMWAKVEDGSIQLNFRHLTAMLKMTIQKIPAGAKSLVLTADKQIAGTFKFDRSEEYPVLTATSSGTPTTEETTLTIALDESTVEYERSFYIPLPAQSYDAISVKIMDSADKVCFDKQIKNVTLHRAGILVMPTVGCTTIQACTPNDVTSQLGNAVTGTGTSKANPIITEIQIDVSESSSDAVSTEENNTTISVPVLENHNVSLNFAQTPKTTSLPLVIEEKDVASTATPAASKNEVTVAIPPVSNESDAPNVTVNMPNTTVFFASTETSATFNEVTVMTAQNTFVVEEGVTIKKLTVKGGNVLIKGTVTNLVNESTTNKISYYKQTLTETQLNALLDTGLAKINGENYDVDYATVGGTVYRIINEQADVDDIMKHRAQDGTISAYLIGKSVENTVFTFNKEVVLSKPVQVYADAEIKNLAVTTGNRAIEFIKDGVSVKMDNVKLLCTDNSASAIAALDVVNPHIEVYNSEIVTVGASDVRGINAWRGGLETENQIESHPYILVDNTNIRAMAEKVGDNDYNADQITTFKSKGFSRGINVGVYSPASTATVIIRNGAVVEGYYYAMNVIRCVSGSQVTLSANNAVLDGRAAFNIWAPGCEIEVNQCKLIGRNYFTGSTEWFGNVVINSPAGGTNFKAIDTELKIYNSPHVLTNLQFALDVRSENNTISLLGNSKVVELGSAEYPARLNYLSNVYSGIQNRYAYDLNTFNVAETVVVEGKEGVKIVPPYGSDGAPTIAVWGDNTNPNPLFGWWQLQDSELKFLFDLDGTCGYAALTWEYDWILKGNSLSMFKNGVADVRTVDFVDDNTIKVTRKEGESTVVETFTRVTE